MQKLKRNSFNDTNKVEENDGDPQFWKDKFPAADGKA